MRSFLLIFLAVVMCGCGDRQRAQAGADAAAGIKAARAALEAGYATQEAINILTGVEKYLPAATGVNPAEWPEPRMSPEEIRANPKKYDESAPPIPEGWGAQVWAALTVGGGIAAWLVKRALPLIPGIGGPAKAMVELVADGVWHVASTREQKALDAAMANLRNAAEVSKPLLDVLVTMPPDQLPPQIAALLESHHVQSALIELATPPKA